MKDKFNIYNINKTVIIHYFLGLCDRNTKHVMKTIQILFSTKVYYYIMK